MHPPFGFALFYPRSIAPPSIKSSDILFGSTPWVFIMLVMVMLMILFPANGVAQRHDLRMVLSRNAVSCLSATRNTE